MSIYLIEGRNKAGLNGSWTIQADSKSELDKIIKARGMQARTIDGEAVKRSEAPNQEGETDNGV
jgi:hypothetical protein